MLPRERSLVDHVIVAVRDLDAAAARWRALGFVLSDRGVHPTRGTANFCIAFPNAYLELLSTNGPDCREAFLLDLLARREGGASLALAMDDPAQVHDALRAHLPGIEPPVVGSREIHGRDGVKPIAFDVQRIPVGALLPGRVFFCGHRNPELVYDPALFGHANGARALRRVVTAVDAVPAWPPALADLGFRLVEAGRDVLRIDARGVELVYATPAAVGRFAAPALLPHVPPGPAIVALTIAAGEDRDVAAADAHGVVLSLRAPR
jgi:catechol 2,3-dioxygenase-like lactoylglutathione lyase family enzyme